MSAVVVGRGGERIPVAELAVAAFPAVMHELDRIAHEQADADAQEPIVEVA